ncbi:MAG TPA: chromosomal replication initiator protein DnaA [Syntrophorhabdaceae bacterium]|nr:chromosomal replication initiator protein DnaA [Syntrophorhabdaceae bacterium]HQM81561.1 chromosomal replication initiator protein DnaA [Syntrophorhabdaceae bacterium]
MNDILSQIKPKIANIINEDSYKTWIEPLVLADFKDNRCMLLVPNAFFRDWVVENFEPILVSLIKDLVKKDVTIEYVLKKDERQGEKRGVIVRRPSQYNNFNNRYTFENFVVGSSNQFANAACLAVSTNPGKTYNPLFIYGGVGLGKTHLLNAIGNFLVRHGGINPERICYITAESFTNELINSIRYEKMDEFRNRFRKMDILLIDDIQFIAGKERTQAEFFHTFNTLYDNMKQIVVTSDKFPRDIENFEERLRSRFEWGLVADIQSPDIETKVAILNKKAECEGIDLPLDVAFFIASNSEDSIRSLEGSLIRVGAFASLNRVPINIDLVKDVIGHIIKEKEKEVTIDMIIKEVSIYFSISPSDLKSKKRIKSILIPRQVAIYLSRELTDSSLVSIGEKFGGKDHATIIHSINKIKDDINVKRELKSAVEKLMLKLKST